MLCEKCLEREATIIYTEIINGVKTEHSLCSECAKDMDFGDELPFAELLSGILGAYAVENEKREDTMEQVVCPTCRMSYRDFIRQGVFGCEDCYNVFEPLIEGNIKKIQGNSIHTGKKPRYNSGLNMDKRETVQEGAADQITILKERLKEALEEEDYEEAARLRDEIRALKERNGVDA
ncbi:MAG: UvrB/UvrC motif-containing protein [Lachnospiraceae bacterium]|nr:UvrB/UvrC motif-containing protein [Lachnospiraceae bacterium]